jgi:hypothetical protein
MYSFRPIYHMYRHIAQGYLQLRPLFRRATRRADQDLRAVLAEPRIENP